ncbi:MAG TPA: D-2-hydroxyacid dehydrogenase [Polyangia bacterium]|nr:D-2-hydroxyacid dehydrogenase [Polyangia bacterium]
MADTAVAVLLAQGQAPPDGLETVSELARISMADDPATLARALDAAEVLFVWDFRSRLLAGAWPHATSLRWIHTGSVGVDAVLLDEVVAGEVVVTNTRGVFERPIAEYVLALILTFAKDLRRTLAFQRERRWVHRETEVVQDRRVVVLGAGGVAREVAPLLRAAGMSVQVVGRSARHDEPGLGQVFATTDADELLAEADFVVLALPLTAETRGYLDARRIALLRPGARVINVGRGPLTVQDDLVAALQTGQVAGAALDVFAEEPLPAEHPFWAMDEVIVSPHMSGDRLGWERAVVEGFAENLGRWQRGEALVNVVDKQGLRHPASSPIPAAPSSLPVDDAQP